MDASEIRQLFSELNVWRQGDKRAPNKPLLTLYVLARCYRDDLRLLPYNEVEQDLGKLLRDFGPKQKSKMTPENPFWRLQTDGFWGLSNTENVRVYKSGSPNVNDLKNFHVKGGFNEDVYAFLRAHPNLGSKLAQDILQ